MTGACGRGSKCKRARTWAGVGCDRLSFTRWATRYFKRSPAALAHLRIVLEAGQDQVRHVEVEIVHEPRRRLRIAHGGVFDDHVHDFFLLFQRD